MLSSTERPDYTAPRLPDWVRALRPVQLDAVNAIVDAFTGVGGQAPVDLVVLDAPVGSGKTLIGELVRRELPPLFSRKTGNRARTTYICSDRALQTQVTRDFPYARVLMGRANYPTELRPDVTCDECTITKRNNHCSWCETVCPYQYAKGQAMSAGLAVLNTAMFLACANYAGGFMSDNGLVIADECDLIEDALIGFVEYEVPEWAMEYAEVVPPIKGARKPTLLAWLRGLYEELSYVHTKFKSELTAKRERALDTLIDDTDRIITVVARDVEGGETDEDAGHWFRDYETRTFKMRPVTVAQYGMPKLFAHGQKWLLMSGTVISADELIESLGWAKDYRVVTVPNTFPAENRPIHLAPVADMTRRKGEAEWAKLVYAIEQIAAADMHQGRILVHTVSYRLAEYLWRECDFGGARTSIWHKDARAKHDAMRRYLAAPNAVLFSPSMMRGVDLAGDACRTQIIAKCPFPSLGDKQVSLRLHLPGGQLWYVVKTVRDIVQMTGRGVRSEIDWCDTYILDQQFTCNVWAKWKALFLPSFIEVVRGNQDIRWLIGSHR